MLVVAAAVAGLVALAVAVALAAVVSSRDAACSYCEFLVHPHCCVFLEVYR